MQDVAWEVEKNPSILSWCLLAQVGASIGAGEAATEALREALKLKVSQFLPPPPPPPRVEHPPPATQKKAGGNGAWSTVESTITDVADHESTHSSHNDPLAHLREWNDGALIGAILSHARRYTFKKSAKGFEEAALLVGLGNACRLTGNVQAGLLFY